MTFRHILVAIDGSPHSDLALEAAVAAAQRDRARITLIAVVPDVPAAAATVPALPGDLEAEIRGHVEAALEQIPQDVPVTTLMPHGKPGPTICHEASDRDYDGVFLGARGVGRVGGLVGSVSQHVLHHATTAVVVAHAPRAAG